MEDLLTPAPSNGQFIFLFVYCSSKQFGFSFSYDPPNKME